ncbi:hypothetical protein TNIN_601 [Trichonephila inaurata madagascariensis]|uniref:Uncharacterized protein n=1 Tax=Trichonephila inaurata madagascariensis TaxID=2747483 RepID=A0A8X6KC35_9ARAC|nr:hypothetical protein TNIN_601 [Trichonephila inaurata madagascariensis]
MKEGSKHIAISNHYVITLGAANYYTEQAKLSDKQLFYGCRFRKRHFDVIAADSEKVWDGILVFSEISERSALSSKAKPTGLL